MVYNQLVVILIVILRSLYNSVLKFYCQFITVNLYKQTKQALTNISCTGVNRPKLGVDALFPPSLCITREAYASLNTREAYASLNTREAYASLHTREAYASLHTREAYASLHTREAYASLVMASQTFDLIHQSACEKGINPESDRMSYRITK